MLIRRVNEIRGYKCISLPLRRMGLIGGIRIDLIAVYKDGGRREINISFYKNVKKTNWIFIPKPIAQLYNIEKGDYVEVRITPINLER